MVPEVGGISWRGGGQGPLAPAPKSATDEVSRGWPFPVNVCTILWSYLMITNYFYLLRVKDTFICTIWVRKMLILPDISDHSLSLHKNKLDYTALCCKVKIPSIENAVQIFCYTTLLSVNFLYSICVRRLQVLVLFLIYRPCRFVKILSVSVGFIACWW